MLIYQIAIANIKVTVREINGMLGKDHTIALYVGGRLIDTKGHYVRQRACEIADQMLLSQCEVEYIDCVPLPA